MKKLFALLLTLCLLMTSAALAEVTVSKAGEFPITNEKISLTVWMEGGSDQDWTDNGWLKEMEELTNIHVDIISSSSAA